MATTRTRRPADHPSDEASARVLFRNVMRGAITPEAADDFARTQSRAFLAHYIDTIGHSGLRPPIPEGS